MQFNIPQQPTGFNGFGNQFNSGVSFNNGIQENYSDFGLPNQRNDSTGAYSVQIRKMYFGETRPQSQQHRRNYNSFMTGESHAAFVEKLSVNPNSAMTALGLSDIFSEIAPIISYSATAERKVDVANGWDTPRYRFTMVVDVYSNGRYHCTEFISGYTDYQGINNPGLENSFSLDRDMILHVNQVTRAASRTSDAAGNPIPMISGSAQVISNSNYSGIANPTQMIGMRPCDVAGAISKLSFHQGMEAAADLDVGIGGIRDLDIIVGAIPIMSNADNALATTFAAQTISNIYMAELAPNDVVGMNGVTPPELARRNMRESTFSSRFFINSMQRATSNGVSTSCSFSIGELLMMDPTIDDRALIFGRTFESASDGIYIPDGYGVSNIGTVSNCAIAATCISNTIIQLMNKAGVSIISLHLDNLTGRDEGVVQAASGMDYDKMLAQRLEMIKSRMIIEAIPLIKPNIESSYEVNILADAVNDVFVEVTIDGQSDQFLIPAFASSSFSPIITNDMGTLNGLAENMDTLVKTISTTASATNNIVDHNGNMFNSVTSGFSMGSGSNF